LVPYLVMLAFAGLPIFFMEIVLGQYTGVGPVKIFGRMAPLLRGLGYAVVSVAVLFSFFYMVVVSWSLWYLMASIDWSGKLEWSKCNHPYNTPDCFTREQMDECRANGTFLYNQTCTDIVNVCHSVNATVSKNPNWTANACADPTGQLITVDNILSRSSSVEEYWQRYVLGQTGFTWDNFGTPRLQSVGALGLAWLVVAVCLLKGVKSSGKVVYFTSLFPYALLIVLAFRALTLPGALDGVRLYLTPQWHRLLDIGIWTDAAKQIIFSLGPACGCVITLSSYNKFNRNCQLDAFMIAIGNSVTSVFSGLVVFAILGFMAYDSETSVETVVKGGPGLAFIVYPKVVSQMPAGGAVFSFLFFFMLITISLGSVFGAFETVMSAVTDQLVWLRPYKPHLVVATSAAMFGMGLTFTCGGGIHMFTLFNASAPSWNLFVLTLLEVTATAWLYGAERLLSNLEEINGGQKINPVLRWYWKSCWTVVTPAILSVLLVMALSLGRVEYEGYVYPVSIQALGYLITACTLVWIPIFAIIESRNSSSSPNSGQGLLRPTSEWGRQISYGACATNGNKKGCKDEGPNMDIGGPGWFNQDTCNFDCS